MFPLNNVKVAIYDAEGALVEEGAAEANPDGISWSYTVTTPNENFIGSVIRASAFDIPENEGTLEVIR